MIKTKNLTPDVYYKRSRDFQLLGRTFDFIFNYIKLNMENLYNCPYSSNFDTRLIDLTSTTLGFKQMHEYNTDQLKALCSIFALTLKNKGNIQSINYMLNLLGNVENIDEKFEAVPDIDDPYLLNIYIPSGIEDTNLLEDVLNYILPAGISYKIIKQTLITNNVEVDEYVLDYMKDVQVTRKHVAQNSQVLQVKGKNQTSEVSEQTPNPTPSDIDVGRIDNNIVIGLRKRPEGETIGQEIYRTVEEAIQDTVKENQYEVNPETRKVEQVKAKHESSKTLLRDYDTDADD